MKARAWKFVTLVFGLLLVSCQNPLTPSPLLDELLAAPLVVNVSGRDLKLETFIYRDLMPGTDPNGSPLIALVYLEAVDGQPFPDGIDSDRLWVINGDRLWETEFSDEPGLRDPSHPYQLEKIARDGPRWGVGDRVEVVVRVKVPAAGTRLLRATHQTINAVY
jgi:hypothetical protein